MHLFPISSPWTLIISPSSSKSLYIQYFVYTILHDHTNLSLSSLFISLYISLVWQLGLGLEVIGTTCIVFLVLGDWSIGVIMARFLLGLFQFENAFDNHVAISLWLTFHKTDNDILYACPLLTMIPWVYNELGGEVKASILPQNRR